MRFLIQMVIEEKAKRQTKLSMCIRKLRKTYAAVSAYFRQDQLL